MSFYLNNRILPLDTPFEHDGTSYPANWLRLSSQEERAAIGITEIVDQPRPDDRFWWVSGPNADGSYTAIPKDLAGLKTTWSSQMRQTAQNLLSQTDWLITRLSEIGTPVPEAWSNYREAVRTTCELAIGDLEAAADIDAFIASVTSVAWPDQPETPPAADTTYKVKLISDRQFFQQAATAGFITQDEALKAVQTGFIPPVMQNFIDQITNADDKFHAEMILSGATEFDRNHPMTIAMGEFMGLTPPQVDQFFMAASKL